jgi:hypothetical protein
MHDPLQRLRQVLADEIGQIHISFEASPNALLLELNGGIADRMTS